MKELAAHTISPLPLNIPETLPVLFKHPSQQERKGKWNKHITQCYRISWLLDIYVVFIFFVTEVVKCDSSRPRDCLLENLAHDHWPFLKWQASHNKRTGVHYFGSKCFCTWTLCSHQVVEMHKFSLAILPFCLLGMALMCPCLYLTLTN